MRNMERSKDVNAAEMFYLKVIVELEHTHQACIFNQQKKLCFPDWANIVG